MHTFASNRYQELRIDTHVQQNWVTMMLVKELRERHPKAKAHAAMIAKAVQMMEYRRIMLGIVVVKMWYSK